MSELARKYRKNNPDLNTVYNYTKLATKREGAKPLTGSLLHIIGSTRAKGNELGVELKPAIIVAKKLFEFEDSLPEIILLKDILGRNRLNFNYYGLANKYILNHSNDFEDSLSFYTGYRYKQQITDQVTYTAKYKSETLNPSTNEYVIKDVAITILKDSIDKNKQSKQFVGQLFDSENNLLTPQPVALAEIYDDYPNYICLLFDYIKYYLVNPQKCKELFKEIIKWYAKDIKSSIEEDFYQFIKEEVEEANNYEDKAREYALVNFISKQSEKPLKNLKQSIEATERDTLSYQKVYMNKLSELYDLKAQYDALEKDVKSNGKDLAQSLKDVKNNMPVIADIYVDDKTNNLVIITNSIYSVVNKLRYYFGEFKVEFDFDSVERRSDFVKFYNLNDSCRRPNCWSGGYGQNRRPDQLGHHPHVNVRGVPCLGNAADLFIQCAKSLDILGVINTAISFLQSVNTADIAGKHVTSWDEVDENGNVIQTGYHYDDTPPNKMTIYCEVCGAMVVGANNLYLSRTENDNMNVCHDCTDKVVTCASCGEWTDKESVHSCSVCGNDYCSADCFTSGKTYDSDKNACYDCHLEEELKVGNIIECPICKDRIDSDSQYTCEVCGTSGCADCIQIGNDNRYLCKNCK